MLLRFSELEQYRTGVDTLAYRQRAISLGAQMSESSRHQFTEAVKPMDELMEALIAMRSLVPKKTKEETLQSVVDKEQFMQAISGDGRSFSSLDEILYAIGELS